MTAQRLFAVVLCASSLVGLACTPQEDAVHSRVEQRLVDETGDMFAVEVLTRKEEVFAWTFQSPADLALWQDTGMSPRPELRQGRIAFGYSELGAALERPADLEAASVDIIEVEMTGAERGPLRLRWASADGAFDPDHVLQAAPAPYRKPTTYIFDLQRRDDWQGTIERLRLLPRLRPGQIIQLQSVRGYRIHRQDEALAAAKERSWKVELEDQTRGARLVELGETLRETLDVPANGRLEAAFGVHASLGKTVDFELVVQQGDDRTVVHAATVSAGRKKQRPAGHLAAGRWHDVAVDLAPWAGESIALVMSATSDAATAGDLAFWADLTVSAPQTGKRPPDVVLVVLDTLRADHMSAYGYQRPTTPKLDALARRGTVFESTVASAAWTFPTHISMFTGLDPFSHGQHNPRPIPESFDLLAEYLQAEGYRTLAVTGGGYVDPHYGFSSGFDRYYTYPGDKKGIGDLTPGLKQARKWLKDEDRPVFLFIHTYEVHSPYRIREPFYEQLSGAPGDPDLVATLTSVAGKRGATAGAVHRKHYGWRQKGGSTVPLTEDEHAVVRDVYDASLAYADHHVGDFLADFEARGGDPLVVITSDHGEGLGDQGLAEHAYLLDFNLMIPLIVRLPGDEDRNGRVGTQVRQVDLMPTMLAALDIEPRQPMDGLSLLPLIDDPQAEFSEPAWSVTSLQGISMRKDNRFKYIFNHTLVRGPEILESLFLLHEDPQERNNMAGTRPTDDLRKLLIERYQQEFTGLLVTVENPGDTPHDLSISGPVWLAGGFFKTVDAPSGVLKAHMAGELRVEIPADSRFSFVAEQVFPGTGLVLELTTDGTTCRLPLEDAVADLTDGEPIPAVLFSEGCRTVEAAEGATREDALRLGFFYSQDSTAAGTAQDVVPSALQDQLKALGYVD